jgi:hypothetical protein
VRGIRQRGWPLIARVACPAQMQQRVAAHRNVVKGALEAIVDMMYSDGTVSDNELSTLSNVMHVARLTGACILN